MSANIYEELSLEKLKEAIKRINSRPYEKSSAITVFTGQWGWYDINMAFRFERMTPAEIAAISKAKASWKIRGLLAIVDINGYIWKYKPGKGWDDKPSGAGNSNPPSRSNPKASRFNLWEQSLKS